MVSDIYIQKYSDFPFNEREILRYAGCMGANDGSDMVKLMNDCISEVASTAVCTFNICYRFVPVVAAKENGDIDFEIIKVGSTDLYKCIKGCKQTVFMAGTIGHGLDRLIRRYNHSNQARAIFMQAIGAERVETMLDYFCLNFEKELTPRYSPGYGDLSLSIQPDFLKMLDASRKIGITINDSLLMTPSKSVTAIAGIK